jgi:hypothetical protein
MAGVLLLNARRRLAIVAPANPSGPKAPESRVRYVRNCRFTAIFSMKTAHDGGIDGRK